MSLLKFVNVLFFQWFFVRLTKCLDHRVESINIQSYDLTLNGVTSRGTGDVKTYSWYSIQYWILPCTGWWSRFIYLNKYPNFIKLTKEKRDNNRLK